MRYIIITPMFTPSYAYGGPPRSAFGLAKGLQSIGKEVAVIASRGNGEIDLDQSENWTEYDGVPVIYLKRFGKNNYFYSSSLADEIRKTVIPGDVVILRAVWTYFNTCSTTILKKRGIPYFQYG